MQQVINETNIHDLMDSILAHAKRAGATAAELDVKIETGFSATARLAQAETLEYHHDNDVSITVYDGQRSGSVSTSDLRETSLQTAVEAAIRIARYAEPDPAAGLAEKSQLATDVPKLAINFPWALSAQEAMRLAQQCDQLGLDYDKRIINSDGATISSHQSLMAYANSQGFNQHYLRSVHSMSHVLVAKDNSGMQRDYYYYSACDAKQLPSIEQMSSIAAERTLKRLDPRDIGTGKFPVLFSAETARSLIGHFVSAIQSSALYKKSSFLLDQLGASIFPEWFNLWEEPHLARGLGSVPFDANGLLTYQKPFIENGQLKNYALGVYGARKLNMSSTANAGGTHNLLLTTGQQTFADLLQELHSGFLVTEIVGQGVNLVTGDYSRGAAGFWIENGEIQFAVDEATIAGNLRDMFKNIRCVGNDVDLRGKIRTPAMLVDGMMVAGGRAE